MSRKLVTTVLVGALTYAVYLTTGGTVPEQAAYLTDAGVAVTHVATCPVRIDPDCVAKAAAAGVTVRTNDRLRFPVSVAALPDGGRDVTLPPMPVGLVRQCVEVKDWSDCTLALAATDLVIAATWGTALPFRTTGIVKRCVRSKPDAGLACLRSEGDGGSRSFGARNVFQRVDAVDPATCEPVECSMTLGEDPEVDL